MNIYASILLCFAPLAAVFVLCVFFVKELKITHALLAVVLGLVALIPIAFLQMAARTLPVFAGKQLFSVLFTAILFNGIIEECIKLGALFVLPVKNKPVAVCIALAAILGLSVGCFETVIYLLTGHQNIVLRLCTAAVIHTICAVLLGFSVWAWKNARKKTVPVLYAIIIHGVYNFFAGFSGGFWWFSLAAICLGALECRIWYQKIVSEDISGGI